MLKFEFRHEGERVEGSETLLRDAHSIMRLDPSEPSSRWSIKITAGCLVRKNGASLPR